MFKVDLLVALFFNSSFHDKVTLGNFNLAWHLFQIVVANGVVGHTVRVWRSLRQSNENNHDQDEGHGVPRRSGNTRLLPYTSL